MTPETAKTSRKETSWSAFRDKIRVDPRDDSRLILNVHSGLERVLLFGGGSGLFLGVGTFNELSKRPGSPREIGLALMVIGGLMLLCRSQLEDVIVVDLNRRLVELQRRLFGRVLQPRRLTRFEALQGLVVQPDRSEDRNGRAEWRYGLSLLQRDGTLIPVLTPSPSDYGAVSRDGVTLAGLMGVELQASQPCMLLKVRKAGLEASADYHTYMMDRPGAQGYLWAVLLFVVFVPVLALVIWSYFH